MLVRLIDICDRLTMTAVDALLDGPHAQRAFLLKAVFADTWSITVEDHAPLTVVVMAQGEATFTDASGPQRITERDVILARGPAAYTVADSPDTPPDIRILPDQVCIDPTGAILTESMSLGVRTWGNTRSPDATVMLIGTYERETAVGALLLAQLPESLVLHEFDPALVEMLSRELVGEAAGQSAVLDRLLDLVVVQAVRSVLGSSPAPSDPMIANALRAMEEHPEHPWTVRSLGTHVGLSRAALARRFTQHVGESPLSYLTRWRLALAADLLAGTDLTLAAIAARVGYANPFALSAAFKRAHGLPPSRYRATHAA
jgi:AraC-like DNA-binding protein